MCAFHVFKIIQMVPNRATHHNYENLIAQIHNFVIEKDTRNRKLIMLHADHINSVKLYK